MEQQRENERRLQEKRVQKMKKEQYRDIVIKESEDQKINTLLKRE